MTSQTPSGPTFEPGDALLIVDVQNDFCPGGALAIQDGDAIIPALNQWIARAEAEKIPILASRDWHPLGHVSFREGGGPWPPHCLQDDAGAAFHPALNLPRTAVIVTKGTRFDHDQTSAFDDTGLAFLLRQRGILRLWIGGLAEDVCVRATVLDALRNGFAVVLIADGVKPVTPTSGRQAREEMRQAGACLYALPSKTASSG